MRQPHIGLLLLTCAVAVSATTYYVRPGGNDGRDGRSHDNAWATLQKLTDVAWTPGFSAGDSILFEGGSTVTTGSEFYIQTDRTTSTAANPIVVGSYGTGRATVQANGCDFLMVWGPGTGQSSLGIRVENLNILGDGTPASGPSNTHGILVWNSSAQDIDMVEVIDCDISGFAGDGVATGRDGSSAGRINNVVVRGVVAHDNPGASGVSPHTGTGIVVAGARRALIERCIAYNNGINNNNPGGPIGIWFWDCTTSVIQHCESYDNQTTHGDGGGFDLDGGCQGCIIQYCYSHGNAGAGYLFAQFSGAASGYGPLENNVIRYCISENDGRKGGFGAFTFWGAGSTDRVGSNLVHNNTVYMAGTPDNGSPSCVWFLDNHMDGVVIRNNVFVAADGHRLVNAGTAFSTSQVLFQGNCYHAMPGTSFQVRWGGSTHASLAAFRGVGQERHNSTDVGIEADPLLTSPGTGITVGDPANLSFLAAYTLQAGSPCIDEGLDLPSLYGTDMGSRDFWGNAIPVGGAYDIGAHDTEPQIGVSRPPRRAPSGSGIGHVHCILSGRSCGHPAAHAVQTTVQGSTVRLPLERF